MGYIEDLRKLVGHRPVILPGAVAIILDEKGRILLQQRTHPKGAWGIPGGLMELGESTEEVAKREVYEETGLIMDHLQLLNVYSGPQYFSVAANGDEYYSVSICYYTNEFSGEIRMDSSESMELQFFYPEDMPDNIVKTHRIMLNDFLSLAK
ncbi:NUDIX domain-containing protein [Oceanobacillus piezotolerans]|uniref:NUDIX domain-containing protein n=1 Tax=Oceanobacillus piezotolerans TaxID=2448030 RepID=A0A498DGC9_9BACI|nr:NUDIX hydrolase [Oceanobacillus piezotolerans]RLL43692.1 NUDIX domain-containing protein [Oceanobacillus piezotolerans]